jgi:hypothetical protein
MLIDWSGFVPRSGHLWFVVDEVPMGQASSVYLGFPYQFSFHRFLHTHLSSWAGTIGPVVTDGLSELSLTQPSQKYIKYKWKNTWIYEDTNRICGLTANSNCPTRSRNMYAKLALSVLTTWLWLFWKRRVKYKKHLPGTADKGWFSSLGIGRGANNSSP